MGYCSRDDIEILLGEAVLTQLASPDGVVLDTGVVDRAIEDADAEIDAYCGTRYDVPFAAVPAVIRKRSADMAAYNLYSRAGGMDETAAKRYEDAVRFLRDVSAGRVSLGGSAPEAATGAGVQVSTSRADREFTMGRASDGSGGTLDNF